MIAFFGRRLLFVKEEGKKRRRLLQVSGQEEACSRARFYRFNLYGAVVVFAEERGRLAECFCGCGRKMLPLPGTYSPEAAGGCNKTNVSDVIPMMNTKRPRCAVSNFQSCHTSALSMLLRWQMYRQTLWPFSIAIRRVSS